MSLKTYIRSRSFFLNIGAAMMLLALLIWGCLKLLDAYTHHGEAISVPDFGGVHLDSLDRFAEGKDVSYVIIDSVYDLEKPRGVVIEQDPPPDFKVKRHRKIYLTVNAKGYERVRMPWVKDISERQAVSILESYELRIDSIVYIPSEREGVVIHQKIGGRNVAEGTPVPKGTKVRLEVGGGLLRDRVQVPPLYGLTLADAAARLEQAFLYLGTPIADASGDETDTAHAVIYDQRPRPHESVFMGSYVDVWFTAVKGKVPVWKPSSDTTYGSGDSLK